MTVRNHYPRHYRRFYHQIQMFSHHFPSTFLNVCFIMCLFCCTNEGLKPAHQIEEKNKFTSTTRTLQDNVFDHHRIRINSNMNKNRETHENDISEFIFDKRKAESNLKVNAKTVEQKINGDTKIMIPLYDEITSFDNHNKNNKKNSSNIKTSSQYRNRRKLQDALGLYVNVRPNNSSSLFFAKNRGSHKVGITQQPPIVSQPIQPIATTSISKGDEILRATLYPPIPAKVQISRASAEERTRTQKSSIAKFLLEPELGQSWYNKNGPTPTFHDGQTNGTTYNALLGSDAYLDCQVTALEKDLVSWLKVASSSSGFQFPVLLTVGFRPPHASENRFMLDFLPPHNYRLRIDNVQWRDEGRYICQLAVHPPSLIWSRLKIIRPLVHLLDSDMKPVADLHYDVGTTIEMICRVKRPPKFHVSVQWEVQRLHSVPSKENRVLEDKTSDLSINETDSDNFQNGTFEGVLNTQNDKSSRNIVILNQDVTRGGVKVDTGRDSKTGYIISRLSLVNAKITDIGNYTCRLSSLPNTKQNAKGLHDTISVHVLQGENTKAIQGANEASKPCLNMDSYILLAQLTFCLLAKIT